MLLQATTYTCPLYACLLSLIVNVGQDLVGKQLLCFSYGSGCAASMFGVRVVGVPLHPPDILDRLRNRTPKSIATALPLIQAFDNMYGKFGFEPSHRDDRQHGAFYLTSVNEKGVRSYERHEKRKSIAVHRERDRPVTWIEFLQETLDADMVTDLTKALEPGRIHVFTCEGENFCVGASASGEIDMQTFLKGTAGFAALHKKLEECCELPIIVLCNGATRGGGMLFPNMAHVVIATADATFGYPEVRRGVLPGVVSVSAQRRMSRRQCRRWMLTGHVFDAASAKSRGVVDAIVETSREAARRKLHCVVDELLSVDPDLLKAYTRILASNGNMHVAVIEAGNLNLSHSRQSSCTAIQNLELFRLTWHGTAVACLELADPNGTCNLLTWDAVTSLASHIQDLKANCSAKVVMMILRAPDSSTSATLDPFKLMSGPEGNTKGLNMQSTAAVMHRIVSVYKQAISDMPVPIIAVLQGNLSGAWLALALSADYRIAVEETKFLVKDDVLHQLFDIGSMIGMVIGEARWNRFLRESPDIAISSETALNLGMVSSVHDITKTAVQKALAFAKQIECAPSSNGTRNTLSLLRLTHNGEAAASTCVRLARIFTPVDSVDIASVQGSGCDNDRLVIEDHGFATCIKLAPNTTIRHLHETLVKNSSGGKPILIIQSSNGDLENVVEAHDSLISFIEWFRSEVVRPTIIVCSDGSDLCILLPLLADVSLATPSSSFKTNQLHPVVYSCLAADHGVAGCGRLVIFGGCNLSSAHGYDMGIVHNLVDADQTVTYLTTAFQFSYEGLRWHQPSSLSFAEAVVLKAKNDKILSVPSALTLPVGVSWRDSGLACVQLSSLEDLEHALDELENRGPELKAVVIDATCGTQVPLSECSTFMMRVRFFSAVVRMKHRLECLTAPVCTVLSGSVSLLAAVVACASTYRVGDQATLFDFTDDLFSAVILDLIDGLPCITGIAQAETIRLQRPVIHSSNALASGLLTSVLGGDSPIIDTVCASAASFQSHRLERLKYFGLNSAEQAERCLVISRQMEPIENLPAGNNFPHIDIIEREGVIYIKIRVMELSPREAESISQISLVEKFMCVFYLEPDDETVGGPESESSYSVGFVERILSYKMPVIVVCKSARVFSSTILLQVMSAADIVIASSCVNDELLRRSRVTLQRFGTKWAHCCRSRFELVDVIVQDADVVLEVEKLTSRFRQISSHILCLCKEHLPASTLHESRIAMATLNSSAHNRPVELNLVLLEISSDGVATLELNDPDHFNAESPQLVNALRARLLEVTELALQKKVTCLVLQGAGPHFCTGGSVKDGKLDFSFSKSEDFGMLKDIADMSGIATLLRMLPIPTVAAVHGKVVGGGLALCLAADWRACTNDARFAFGNISKGMSPLFMLSRSLPLTVGWGFAMEMYLEDSVISAHSALSYGLVNSTADTLFEVKSLARDLAKSFQPVGTHFHRGRIGQICARDIAHSSREIEKLLDTALSLQKLGTSTNFKSEPFSMLGKMSDTKRVTHMSGPGGKETSKGRFGWLSHLDSFTRYDERRSAICEMIMPLLVNVGVPNISETTPWGEAGLDSLSMVELRDMLSKVLGEAMALSSTVLFDYPNLDALVHHIDTTLFPPVIDKIIVSRALRVEPLAIVGMACRCGGGVDSVGSMWSFLEGCRNAIRDMPLERLDWRKLYDPDPGRVAKMYTKRGAFVDGVAMFDCNRFGISAAEARVMAPHQRLALETTYEALQQAGVALSYVGGGSQRRRIGTFVAESGAKGLGGAMVGSDISSPYAATGAAQSITANRLAYLYGFSSPSMTIDTACSSGLVALDTAVKAIYNNDCESAVVLGVNVILSALEYVPLCAAKMLSPSGRCAAFSHDADGFARAEGCAAVVLKPLSIALKDGNGIWGVVHGTAVNQDGRTATLSAPNGPAQEEVIRTALQRAEVTPNQIGYVEAHGTGTPLGDPIEAAALTRVFKGRLTPLVVGALKSNIGHLEAAAGLAGLIKAVLCLHHGRAPPNIHCERLNPLLAEALAECPLVFPRDSTALDGRYAGVSSFGFGGTNAHAVIGLAPVESAVPVQPLIEWHREPFRWWVQEHILLGALEMQGDIYVWTCNWEASVVEYLSNHCVRDNPIVPGACYMEMVACAVEQLHGDIAFEVNNVTFTQILYLEPRGRPTVRLNAEPVRSEEAVKNEYIVRVESWVPGLDSWTVHVNMRLKVGLRTEQPPIFDIEGAKERCPSMHMCGDEFYKTVGNLYQGDFRSLEAVWHGRGESLGLIQLKSSEDVPEPLLRCALLDSAQHLLIEELDEAQRDGGMFAAGIGKFYVPCARQRRDTVVWSHLETRGYSGEICVSEFDPMGQLLVR